MLVTEMKLERTVRKGLLCLIVLIAGAYLGSLTVSLASAAMMNAIAVTASLILALAVLLTKTKNPFVVVSFSTILGFALGGLTGWLQQLHPAASVDALVVAVIAFAVLIGGYSVGVFHVSESGSRIFYGTLIGYLISLITVLALSVSDILRVELPVTLALLVLALVGVGLASYRLVMDFDWIRAGVTGRLDASWEWHGAFRPIISFSWYYLEFLVCIQLIAATLANLLP